MTLDLFYIIYLNMVGNKCLKITFFQSFSEVCESWHLIKDIYRLPAAEGAAGCLRSSLHGQLPPRLMLVAGAVSTVLNR